VSDTDALTLATKAVEAELAAVAGSVKLAAPMQGVAENVARAALEAVGALADGAQPLPVKNDQRSCHDLAIEWIEAHFDDDHAQRVLVEALRARKLFGLAKYGTALQAYNGRDPRQDAFAEALDLIVYAVQFETEEWDRVSHGAAPEAARNAALSILSQALETGLALAAVQPMGNPQR
jgi:hypothetical protein